MNWSFDFFLILCEWTSTLKLFYEGLVAENLKSKPKAWHIWVENFLFFIFSFFVIELQTSSYFMKVLVPRAWNLSPRLGLYELKFKTLFLIIWFNFKPQIVFWGSHCRELKMWVQGLAYMSKMFNIFFHTLWLNFKLQAAFLKVSLPRAWNLIPRLGLYELKFKILFSIIRLNFTAQAIIWRSSC